MFLNFACLSFETLNFIDISIYTQYHGQPGMIGFRCTFTEIITMYIMNICIVVQEVFIILF